MKLDEKMISILQQDVELPDIVARKADAAFSQILAANQEEIVQTGRRKNKTSLSKRHGMRWHKAAIAIAALLAFAIGGCVAKPELAAKIFAMLQGEVSYSGDYVKYAETVAAPPSQEPLGDSAGTTAYSKTVNGVKVTIIEVYCNQEALNISMTIEGKEPFRDKLLTDQSGHQKLYLDMENTFSFRPQPVVGNAYLEGSFIDDRTYAGIWRMDLKRILTDYTAIDKMALEAQTEGRDFVITEEILNKYSLSISLPEQFTVNLDLEKIIGDLAEQPKLDWGMSTKELEALSEEEFTELYNTVARKYGIDHFPNTAQNYCMEGPWEFTVPVTVNNVNTRTITVEDTNEKGIGLASVTITPFEMSLNLIFEHNDGSEYYPVVLDADGEWIAPSGYATSFPVAGHDTSRIYVYLCDYLKYMDELKGKQDQDNFRQILEENSVYSKEVRTI